MKFQDDISMPHTHTHTHIRTSRNQYVPHFFKVGGIKRDKLYKRWSRSGRPDDKKKFLDLKDLVRRITDRAYEKYLKDILGLNKNSA